MDRGIGPFLRSVVLLVMTVTIYFSLSPAILSDGRMLSLNVANATSSHCSIRTNSPLRPGAILVGALFQFHEEYSSVDDQCSKFLGWDAAEQAMTFHFVFDKLSSVNNTVIDWGEFATDEPTGKTGWIVRDTCTSNVLSMMQSLDLAAESLTYREEYDNLLQQYVGCEKCKSLQSTCEKAKLIGVLGPASDEEVAAVSPLLTSYEIPHLSFWASSTSFNDVNRYPYLFRTVPSIDHQVAAMIDLLEYFGWNYISVVGAQDDLYSGRAVDLIQRESHIRVKKFCIGQVIRFSTRDMVTMRELVRKLRADVQARVVILFAPLTPAKAFLDMMDEENVTEKILIGSNDWVSRLSPFGKPILNKSTAVFGFTPHHLVRSEAHSWFEELIKLGENTSSPSTIEYIMAAVKADPWFRVYLEHLLQCRFEGKSPCTQLEESVLGTNRSAFFQCTSSDIKCIQAMPFLGRTEPLMFAMEVLAKAQQQAYLRTYTREELAHQTTNRTRCLFLSGEVVRGALRNITMPCLHSSGRCKVFNANQQVDPAFKLRQLSIGSQEYSLKSIALWLGQESTRNVSARLFWDSPPSATLFAGFNPTSNSTLWPLSACSSQCQPGERRIFYNTRLALCCWRCERCAENQVSSYANSDSCEACQLGMKPAVDYKRCVVGEYIQLEYSNGFVTLLIIFAVIGAFLNIFTLAFFYRLRTHTLVRSSDYTITMVILIASLASHCLSPFTVGAGRLTSGMCKFGNIMTTPFKIVVIAAILVKTNRFMGIFNAAKQLKIRSRLFTTPVQLGLIALLSFIGLCLVAAYSSTVGTELVYPSQTERRVICTSSDVWEGILSAYHICLVIIAVIFAFMTRNLPENYNEAQQIYFAALTTLVVWVGFTPALYVSNSYLHLLIVTFSAEAQMWAVWLCLYLPRSILLFRSRHRASRQSNYTGTIDMPTWVQVPLSASVSQKNKFASSNGIIQGNGKSPHLPAAALKSTSL